MKNKLLTTNWVLLHKQRQMTFYCNFKPIEIQQKREVNNIKVKACQFDHLFLLIIIVESTQFTSQFCFPCILQHPPCNLSCSNVFPTFSVQRIGYRREILSSAHTTNSPMACLPNKICHLQSSLSNT
jgi:hypothetical protein